MTDTGSRKPDPIAGLGLVGAGAAACAVCCAGPILGFLTATGIASVLGTFVFGGVGLLAVLAVAAVLWLRRRRRRRRRQRDVPTGSTGSTEPTPVAAPQLRTRTTLAASSERRM